jgi:hypothetical protein
MTTKRIGKYWIFFNGVNLKKIAQKMEIIANLSTP